MENLNQGAIAAQPVQFQPTSNPFDSYLQGEERAFKIIATGLLYPFSQPDLWVSLIGQGTIVKVSDLKNAGLESSVMAYIPSKDWEGLRDFLNNALKPSLIEEAKKAVIVAKEKARAKAKNPEKAAAKYPEIVAEACRHLHANEGKSASEITKELGISYPTVLNYLPKKENN